jgi:hypothetical protein
MQKLVNAAMAAVAGTRSLLAYRVCRVGVAEVRAIRWADACPTRLSDGVRVDRDDVGHSEEGCQTSSYLRKEITPLPFF